jgi:hypothetical protein
MRTLRTSPGRALGAAALALGLAAGAGAQSPPPAADFGDAPDNQAACEAGGFVDPALYPTEWGTGNAAPGRTAPFHVLPSSPSADYFLGLPPTYEPVPPGAFEPYCDWLSAALAPPPPTCDQDNAPIVLCLNGGCTTGVWAAPGGPCTETVAAPFGVAPTGLAYWVFEAGRGPKSAAPGYVNVAVDYDLDGAYGSSAGEWVLKDEPLTAAPGASQVVLSGPFPATTLIIPCPHPLGWCIAPFWTRFLLSDEALGKTFDGTSSVWDGSGALSGYVGGETEDWIVETDPQDHRRSFPDRDLNGVPDGVDFIFDRLHDRDRDGQADECRLEPVPDIEVEIVALDLGGVGPRGVSQRTLTITNRGTAPLKLAGAFVEGTNAGLFSVASGRPSVLKPGEARRFLVASHPTRRDPSPRSSASCRTIRTRTRPTWSCAGWASAGAEPLVSATTRGPLPGSPGGGPRRPCHLPGPAADRPQRRRLGVLLRGGSGAAY